MNLASIIDDHPDDRVALRYRGAPITYGELRAQVAAFRGALAREGVARGDRVALLCGNAPCFVVTYLAVAGLGAVAVPLNPTSPAPELARELAVVRPSAAVVEPAAAPAWGELPADVLGSIPTIVATRGHQLPDALTYEDLLDGEPHPVVDVGDDDLAALLFTSGTAGSPRAAMLTHGNLLANIAQNRGAADRIRAEDVVYGVLPLHHIFGLNVVLGVTLAAGACVVLVERFDPATALDTIIEREVTIVPGVPPMWAAWAQFGDQPREAFSRLRLALSGAARLPEEVSTTLRDRFGLLVREGYGLTEASPVVTTSVGIDVRPGSIGRPVPGVEVRVVDEDGAPVLLGDAGEIWVHGPNVFAGYWEDAEATARALTPDGWLRTGDVAVVDDDGYLYLVDRAKDLIIVSGFNVYPAEVEEVIAELPGVREVAVVGVPHPHTGESVKAYVVPDGDVALSEEAVIAWCRDQIARYKCPTKVLFVTELPKGLAGKVLKRALR